MEYIRKLVQINLFKGWKVEITQFHSDRVNKKIEEINFKGQQQALQSKAKGKEKKYTHITISDEGLETIESETVHLAIVDIMMPVMDGISMTMKVREKYDKLISDGLLPIKRWGTPEDVARAVFSLVNGSLPYVTGQSIDVDGGFHMRRL